MRSRHPATLRAVATPRGGPASLPWSAAARDDELAHDADLDVEALHVLHGVSEAAESEEASLIYWLHSHGLGEIGGFYFDVLRPASEFVEGWMLMTPACNVTPTSFVPRRVLRKHRDEILAALRQGPPRR